MDFCLARPEVCNLKVESTTQVGMSQIVGIERFPTIQADLEYVLKTDKRSDWSLSKRFFKLINTRLPSQMSEIYSINLLAKAGGIHDGLYDRWTLGAMLVKQANQIAVSEDELFNTIMLNNSDPGYSRIIIMLATYMELCDIARKNPIYNYDLPPIIIEICPDNNQLFTLCIGAEYVTEVDRRLDIIPNQGIYTCGN